METVTAQQALTSSDRRLLIDLVNDALNRQPSAEYAESIGQPGTADLIRDFARQLRGIIAKLEDGA